ncbi:hypothetical protein BDV11DRAFT_168577 [Aspergillus similis]
MTSTSPDFETLFLRAVELRKQAEERQRQAEAYRELIQYCHNYYSRPLRTEIPSRSTTRKIPEPTGKHCPSRLEHWSKCESEQRKIYKPVCFYLEPPGQTAARLFSPCLVREDFGKRFKREISSEQDLEGFKLFGAEYYVSDIITELCKSSAARDEFRLCDGVRFDSHANSLVADETDQSQPNQPNESAKRIAQFRPSKPDQFCIHRVHGVNSTILTTVKYKPAHRLSVQNLRVGLRPMDFWKGVIIPKAGPMDEDEKLRYNAARLTGSVVAEEYHVMIQEGLEYS